MKKISGGKVIFQRKGLYMKSQTGRSMVEMLDVLAIIGVLSVGGIAGYRIAMEKWKNIKLMK